MKISIIVAVYNVADYLKDCISNLCKMEEDIEIILIDDGSNDGSAKVCDDFAILDSRIKVIHQENQGVSIARNNGIIAATGDWLCFVDGDDVLSSSFCVNLSPYLVESLDMVIFRYTEKDVELCNEHSLFENIVELKRREIEKIRVGLLNSDMTEMEYYKKSNYNLHSPWGKLYRKDFLVKNNLYFVPGIKKGQDMLFNFDVYKYANHIKLIPFIGYYYRLRADSIGHKYNPNIVQINLDLINQFFERICSEKRKILLNNFYLMVVRQFVFCMLLDCCHPLNKKSYRKRKKDFLVYRNNTIFADGFYNAKLSKIRLQVRIFAFFCKYRIFLAIDLIAKIKKILGK